MYTSKVPKQKVNFWTSFNQMLLKYVTTSEFFYYRANLLVLGTHLGNDIYGLASLQKFWKEGCHN